MGEPLKGVAADGLRVIRDPALDGPQNMARDEALLLLVGQRKSPPTFRTYCWTPPTISLGYFQRYADIAALDSPMNSIAVVRRLTGGGAILHDRELTYSIALPAGHSLLSRGPTCLYEILHDALIDTLAEQGLSASRCGRSDQGSPRHGPFFCFSRRHCLDVVVGSGKIAGSAQRRTREAVLQHGSIMLENNFPQQRAAAIRAWVRISDDELIGGLTRNLARRSGLTLVDAPWTPGELAEAASLVQKYCGQAWTCRS